MRILVTGASGLLGSTLVPHLHGRGHTIVTCARGNADIAADLTNPEQSEEALRRAAADVVINLAALTNVDECERDPQRAFLANTRVVENIVAGMEGVDRPVHLIHISTDQMYDGPGPHAENDVVLSNYYGFSKYAGELAAARASSTVLRTNFFGKSQREGRASFSDWLVRSFREAAPITLFDDVIFSPLSLCTLASSIETVLTTRHPGIFNLGSTTAMSKADFAFALARTLELSTDAVRRGRSGDVRLDARRPTDMSMDSSRFQRTFGVTLPTLEVEIDRQRSDYLA